MNILSTENTYNRINFSIKNIITSHGFLNWLMDWHQAWKAIAMYNLQLTKYICSLLKFVLSIGEYVCRLISLPRRSSSHNKMIRLICLLLIMHYAHAFNSWFSWVFHASFVCKYICVFAVNCVLCVCAVS